MDLEKDTQVEAVTAQPLSNEEKSETSDASPICAESENTPDNNPNVVDFDQNDPEDPQNWSTRYKWSITMLLALMAIIV